MFFWRFVAFRLFSFRCDVGVCTLYNVHTRTYALKTCIKRVLIGFKPESFTQINSTQKNLESDALKSFLTVYTVYRFKPESDAPPKNYIACMCTFF